MSTTKAEILTQLPPVAKSFYAFCKKCDAERFHVVLAHTTAKSAKIKCEVCKSTKSWSLPKTSTAKPKVAKPGVVKVPRAGSAAAKKSAQNLAYANMIKDNESKPKHPYSMKTKFELHSQIDHPKFGVGFVTAVFDEKVQVHFEDEPRALIHNRK